MNFLTSAPWQLSQGKPEKQVRGMCIAFLRTVCSNAMLAFPPVENSSVYLLSPSLCVCTNTISVMHVILLLFFLGISYLYDVQYSHTLGFFVHTFSCLAVNP